MDVLRRPAPDDSGLRPSGSSDAASPAFASAPVSGIESVDPLSPAADAARKPSILAFEDENAARQPSTLAFEDEDAVRKPSTLAFEDEDAARQPSTLTFEDATPLLADPDLLRAKAEEDGYLFFKRFIDRNKIMDVRDQMLAILDEAGLLHRGRKRIDGIANVRAVHRLDETDANWNGVGVPFELYRKTQKLEAFHALAHEPRLLALYEMLFDERPFVHPRNIARLMLPHRNTHVTPSHQDYLHIQGTTETWTCWIPLGDVPRSLGGLKVLAGSHKAGLLGVTAHPGAGGLESILCGLGYEWAEGDYEAGDIITFHSLTVHKALPNLTPRRIRLSCDMRYQPASEPVDRTSLLPHGPFSWADLYEGWQRPELQYYWQKERLAVTEFDESIRWQKDKIC
ncbi:phytanoyl-CoA dioxygenase [Paenibacillus sp. 32O-W]|uniref:phytanoyl-CoA dioxygenase family protein n=1 Tax=Paenibacillus sp. 32O-W TaxID=1695218 RepID=UPI000722952A|nr:phytanoyl-CoA dioxygenase family protein [Paenibacillus sp. 32O-W]ALS26634.1 phytanoyl-CoA dioxygenase [Paenibacillus sp. 32O-W]